MKGPIEMLTVYGQYNDLPGKATHIHITGDTTETIPVDRGFRGTPLPLEADIAGHYAVNGGWDLATVVYSRDPDVESVKLTFRRPL